MAEFSDVNIKVTADTSDAKKKLSELISLRKPGWKTTEFWITALVVAGGIIAAFKDLLPPKWALICAAFSQAAYAISRGLSKQ